MREHDTKAIHPKNPFQDLRLVAGVLCLDFLNTMITRPDGKPRPDGEPVDRLQDPECLVWWANRAGIISSPGLEGILDHVRSSKRKADRVLQRATTFREALFRITTQLLEGQPPGTEELARLNREVTEALSHRSLTWNGEGFGWVWESTEGLDRLLWPIVFSAGDLLSSNELKRLGRCADETCNWTFLDESRNRSRRWCDMMDCGNRAKVRRYYRRHRVKG